jgi:hypothetical protein
MKELAKKVQTHLGWQETRKYWWLPQMSLLTGNQPVREAATEMSLLTGPLDSTEGCQSTMVEKLGVSPSQYHPWSTSQNHPGMNKRPTEAAVLRCQPRPIIANLPFYQGYFVVPNYITTFTYLTIKHPYMLEQNFVIFS